jgi:hypothetical protein
MRVYVIDGEIVRQMYDVGRHLKCLNVVRF